MGRPRKEHKLSNAEKCRRRRQKQSDAAVKQRKEIDIARKKAKRTEMKENSTVQYEEYKEKDRKRKRLKSKNDDSVSSTSPFTTRQAKSRCLIRAKTNLPKDNEKMVEIVSDIVKDMTPTKKNKVLLKVRWNPSPKGLGRPLALDDPKTDFVSAFLEREDISYTMPGQKDQIYIGKSADGNSLYKAKHYLLWTIRDLLGILNSDQSSDSYFSKFAEEIKFSTLHRLIKSTKHVLYQKDIPHQSCFCDKCENLELLVDGINRCVFTNNINKKLPSNCHDILKLVTCSSTNMICATSKCAVCPHDIDTDTIRNTDSVSFYQWGKSPGNKYPEKTPRTLSGIECHDLLMGQIEDVKIHYFLKKNQHAAFHKQKENLNSNEILVHVDFSENYDNRQQNAIQSAYFGYESYTLYTACVYHRRSEGLPLQCDNYVLVTSSNEHSRTVAFHLNEYLLKLTCNKYPENPIETVHFWSDGCAAQFRSKHCFHQMTKFTTNLKLFWHFFESHHGKGAVDGLGGCVKNTVFRKVKANKVIINSAKHFAQFADTVVSGINVHYADDECLQAIIDEDLSKPVEGTLKVRCVERFVSDNECHLQFFTSSPLSDPIIPFHSIIYPNDTISEVREERNTVAKPPVTLRVGQWHAAYFKQYNYWFIGIIGKLEAGVAHMTFMEQDKPGVNLFRNKQDFSHVEVQDLFYELKEEPRNVGSSTRVTSLAILDQDFQELTKLFENRYL